MILEATSGRVHPLEGPRRRFSSDRVRIGMGEAWFAVAGHPRCDAVLSATRSPMRALLNAKLVNLDRTAGQEPTRPSSYN